MTRQLARGAIPAILGVVLMAFATNGVGVNSDTLEPSWWWALGVLGCTVWLFWAVGRNAAEGYR